jgi:16S rRNA (uracil1498-N3)-methyltransferase
MPPRFYVPLLTPDAEVIPLPADEASHAARVLRVTTGDSVRVFDGRGLERLGTVARATKSHVDVELGATVTAAPEVRARITLAQALLKADKFDDVIRDATMLGVAAVRPMVTTHADVPAAAIRDGGRTERWTRVAVSSVKQCGRAVVPAIEAVASLMDVLAADDSAVRIIMAEPALGAAAATVDELVRGAPSVLLLVGPEGGWDRTELELAFSKGCRPLTLGGRTLRADAAPLVSLSVLLHALGEL